MYCNGLQLEPSSSILPRQRLAGVGGMVTEVSSRVVYRRTEFSVVSTARRRRVCWATDTEFAGYGEWQCDSICRLKFKVSASRKRVTNTSPTKDDAAIPEDKSSKHKDKHDKWDQCRQYLLRIQKSHDEERHAGLDVVWTTVSECLGIVVHHRSDHQTMQL